MIKVIIAAEEALIRAGIDASFPWAALDGVLAGETGNSGELAELCCEHHPDLLVLDSGMPGGLAWLRSLRAEDRPGTVILLADSESEETRNLARELEAAEILVRSALRDGELCAAVERACEAIRLETHGPETEKGSRKTGAWQKFLFGGGQEKLPFRAVGLTLFRLFPENRITFHELQSARELIMREIGNYPAFTHLRQEECEVLVWREFPDENNFRTEILETLQFVGSRLKVRAGCVAVPKVAHGMRFPLAARKAAAMLRDPRLFDCPLIFLDERAGYRQERLESLRKEFVICRPFYRHLEDMSDLKALLDSFPEGLEEGLAGVLKREKKLLRNLGIRRKPEGLDELTGWVCEEAERRLRTSVPDFQPKIRAVMNTIADSLSAPLSREKISRSIHYDGAYFSRLFRQETGMTYMDYLSELRMQRARELVEETDKTNWEIAREIGFPNVSYFFKRFREAWGMTPGECREKSQKKIKKT